MQDPSISEIEPGLFIGNAASSYDVPTLANNHINARVSLGNGKFCIWGTASRRKHVPLDRQLFIGCLDSSTQDILVHMSDAHDFIDRMLLPRQLSSSDPSHKQVTESHSGSITSTPSTVLVHYDQGISRSATVFIAYLMRKRGIKLEDALAAIQAKRKVRPSANFMAQLAVWEQAGYQIWEDTEKKIPKEPYAAYRDKRAELLKAKGLTGDEPVGPVDL